MCHICGRGVANDRGKGPEIGNAGDLHCLQKGLILSQAKCLVPNKDFLAFWALIGSLLVLGAVHVVYLKPVWLSVCSCGHRLYDNYSSVYNRENRWDDYDMG